MKIFKGRKVIAENVEVAESGLYKARGLMLCGSLPKNSALLMIFGKPGKHGIWMPLMRFPIDIVFLDTRKRVVGLHSRAKPISFRRKTWRIYYPEKPAKYAIELPAGQIKRKKLRPKDRMVFQGI
jgi:uncharacterized membrane protein (UPF0127 family)